MNKPRRKFINPLFQEMSDLVHRKNRNALVIVVGESGTGKSWLAVRIAEALDPSFTKEIIKNRVVFKPQDFTNIVAEGNLQKGNAIILDEAGTAVDAHRWWSLNNKAIKYIFQTFRQDNLIVIFTVPIIDYIDASLRKQFKFYIETQEVFITKKICKTKVRILRYNQLYKKLYNPMPIYTMVDGSERKFDNFYFRRADIKLIHEYEKLASPYKTELKKELNVEIQRQVEVEKKKDEMRYTDDEIISRILSNRDRYIKRHGQRTFCDLGLIRYDFRVGDIRSKALKAGVESQLRDE